VAGTGGAGGASGAHPWPLLGRERELTAALRTLRPAADARAGDVLVVAGAGMGKSHLLAAVRDALSREGFSVPAATAVPDDRLVPFASLRAALARLPLVPTSPLVARLLVPVEAASLGPRPVPAELAATASALRGQLDHLARDRPLVLCLDDVHWADAAQQALLHRLCSEPVPRCWALLLTARTDEVTAPPPELPSRVMRLRLRRLPPTPTRRLAELAASCVGDHDPASHERIAARGRGHPFFTVELARMLEPPPDDDWSAPAALDLRPSAPAALDLLQSPVPDRIVELLRRRLAACSPAARRLTACIAVAGDDARLELIEHVSGTLRIDDLGTTVLELRRANLARASGPTMQLEHPLLREAALSTLDPMRRADMHEVVADGLAATASSSTDQQLRVARHRVAAFTVAPGEAHAVGALVSGVAGAAVAHELGAEAVALALYDGAADAYEALPTQRRAAFRPTAFRGRLALAELRCARGDYRSAQETFGAALVLARTATDHAHVWRGTSQVAYLQGDLPEAVARLEDGLARLAPEATVARAMLVLEVGWCRWRQGDETALELLYEAAELAVRGDDLLVLTRALDRYGLVLADHGQIPESLDAFERALSAARRCGDPQEEAVTHLHHVRPLVAVGRRDEAVAELGRAIALSERHGLLYVRSVAHWFAAEVAVAAGDHESALAQRDGELALLTDLGNDLNLEACQRHRAELLRLLGRERDAVAAQREAEAARARLHAPSAGEARSDRGRRS
jgi:tetratricopeptide (TPR) repeat protein